MGLRIERVLETHFHADFVSGHLELAAATGAVISFGDEAHAEFPIDALAHGQRLSLGDVTLEVRHTPGHTPESISIVVWEHADDPDPWGVLTGDTLFIGDVGRPDLLTSVGWSADALARRLYHSIHDQLLSLPDATRLYPAHGAGSACGKNLSTASQSTIGEQRRTNYALAPMNEDEFVEAVTAGPVRRPAVLRLRRRTRTGANASCSTTTRDAPARPRRSRCSTKPTAPSSSTADRPTCSPPAIFVVRSTSGSTGDSPNTPATSCAPAKPSSSSPNPAERTRPASGSPASASTT